MLAVQNTMHKNSDTELELVAKMPMHPTEQERTQNLTAQIFGDIPEMDVPPENLQVKTVSDIDSKVPLITLPAK